MLGPLLLPVGHLALDDAWIPPLPPRSQVLPAHLARQALGLLSANVRRVCRDGSDLAARSQMLLGSMLAGMAFANAPVAAVHALAYPIGAIYGNTAPAASSPWAAPGTYTVKLGANGKTYAQQLTIKMDPRVKPAGDTP